MSQNEPMFFANYNLNSLGAPHRTTETKLCSSYKEAKNLVDTGVGYVIRKGADGINTMKYQTEGFAPSAQESLCIQALLNVNTPAAGSAS